MLSISITESNNKRLKLKTGFATSHKNSGKRVENNRLLLSLSPTTDHQCLDVVRQKLKVQIVSHPISEDNKPKSLILNQIAGTSTG